MISTVEQSKISVDDYLAGEETASIKHEYVAGEVFAMAGAGEAHVTVALNLAAMLRNHVRGNRSRRQPGEAIQAQPDPGDRGPKSRSGCLSITSTATPRGGWVLHPVAEGGELVPASIDFRCPVAAVYEDVALG